MRALKVAFLASGTIVASFTMLDARPLCHGGHCVYSHADGYQDEHHEFANFGVGRTAFYIPGAIPQGTPYNPYHWPYSYDWPYGYGFSGQ